MCWPQVWPFISILSLGSLNYKHTKVLAQYRRGRKRQLVWEIEKTGCGGMENSLYLLRMLCKIRRWNTFSDIRSHNRARRPEVLGRIRTRP